MTIPDPHLTIDGKYVYVVTESCWAGSKVSSWLVIAAGLDEAKRDHGSSGQLYCDRKVRRARVSDSGLERRFG